jgi:hypothetical protein
VNEISADVWLLKIAVDTVTSTIETLQGSLTSCRVYEIDHTFNMEWHTPYRKVRLLSRASCPRVLPRFCSKNDLDLHGESSQRLLDKADRNIVDVLECPSCDGRMRILAAIEDPSAAHLLPGLRSKKVGRNQWFIDLADARRSIGAADFPSP